MAILENEKIDFLWKKIIYGVTKTASAALKFGSNETIASPSPVLPSSVWQQGDEIPATPEANAFIQAYAGAGRIRATNDPTAPANVAWLATTTPGDLQTRATNFIPPTFGSGYAAKVFIGDPNGGAAYSVQVDAANNPASRVALGYMQADVKVKYLAVIEKFLINIEGGTSVQINKQQTQLA